MIEDPTNYTENSSSIIDLIITSSTDFVPYTGVGPPLLDQIRYHCPIIGILDSPKPTHCSFKRKIWLYDRGDYDKHRDLLSNYDWDRAFLTDRIDDIASNLQKLSWIRLPKRYQIDWLRFESQILGG